MKKLLALALALLAGAAQAQPANTPKYVLWQYNLNQTVTPIYCAPAAKISTSDRITASASTTVTAVSGAPFANVTVGAMLHFVDLNGTDYRRSVTVRNSSTSVVVSGAAITVTSAGIQSADSFNISCGATAAFGAFDVAGYNKIDLQVDVGQQVNTGGISFHLQCRNSANGQWVQQTPVLAFPTVASTYTAALTGVGPMGLGSQDVFFQCRVGMFIVTTDDGNDLGTNAEQVTIIVSGRP